MEWSWGIDTKSHLTQYKYRWSQTEIFVALCVHRYIGWCTNIYFLAPSALERLKGIAASRSEHSLGPDLAFWHCFPTQGPRRLGETPAPSREQGTEVWGCTARSRKWGSASRPDQRQIARSKVRLCKNAPTKGHRRGTRTLTEIALKVQRGDNLSTWQWSTFTSLWNQYLPPFIKWRNWDTERLSNLFKVTQLTRSRTGMPTQEDWLQIWLSNPWMPLAWLTWGQTAGVCLNGSCDHVLQERRDC